MGAAEKLICSEAEYWAFEEASPEKHEYVDGYIVNMAGGTMAHTTISTNLISVLKSALRGKPCRPYNSELKIKSGLSNSYFYPDATVICDKPEIVEGLNGVVLNPTLIVEVLSDSSEGYDRGTKAMHYRSIPSLREYVLISQQYPYIESFYKNENGIWQLSEASSGDFFLPSLGISISFADVYEDVEFEGK